ncbi:hypothetical protein EMCRGX_G029385 [Ephydatia muelleri]
MAHYFHSNDRQPTRATLDLNGCWPQPARSTSIYLNDVLLGSIKHLVHYLADKLHLLSGYRFSTTMSS